MAGGLVPKRVFSASVKPGRRTSVVAFSGEEPGEDDPLLAFKPFEHSMPRRNSITPARQRAFIAALAASGIVTQAARREGISLEALYKLRHRAGAEGFSAAWDAAIDRGMARLEDCALERAIEGEERPLVWDGKVVATWKRYDTSLLMFLLRQRRSARYGLERSLRASEIEALHREWSAKETVSAEEVRASIDAKLAKLKEHVMERRRLKAEARAAAEARGEVWVEDEE